MTKEKQIEEMARFLWENTCIASEETCDSAAEDLVNAGYRKASDTVKQMAKILLEDIERALESNYKVIREHGDKDSEPIRELVNRVKGKIDALRGIEGLILSTVDEMLGEGVMP